MAKIVEAPQQPKPDPLHDKIRDSILGVENLRTENGDLRATIDNLERTVLQRESEIQSLKILLEQERAERRHYHSLANELVTRLDVVGQTIHDAVKRAEQEVYRQRRENPRLDPEALPQIKLPSFLEKVEAIMTPQSVAAE